jgi:hypothetical protein
MLHTSGGGRDGTVSIGTESVGPRNLVRRPVTAVADAVSVTGPVAWRARTFPGPNPATSSGNPPGQARLKSHLCRQAVLDAGPSRNARHGARNRTEPGRCGVDATATPIQFRAPVRLTAKARWLQSA